MSTGNIYEPRRIDLSEKGERRLLDGVVAATPSPNPRLLCGTSHLTGASDKWLINRATLTELYKAST